MGCGASKDGKDKKAGGAAGGAGGAAGGGGNSEGLGAGAGGAAGGSNNNMEGGAGRLHMVLANAMPKMTADGTREAPAGVMPNLPRGPQPSPFAEEVFEAPATKPRPLAAELPPTTSHALEGVWSAERDTAGGCLNHPTCMLNPQFLLSIDAGADVPALVDVTVRVTQRYPHSDDGINPDTPLGLYVFRAPTQHRRYIPALKADVASRAEFAYTADVSVQFQIEVAVCTSYIIMPAYYDPEGEGAFVVEVEAAEPVHLRELPAWHAHGVQSSWETGQAGGCANYPTWRLNPQVQMVPTVLPVRVSIVLRSDAFVVTSNDNENNNNNNHHGGDGGGGDGEPRDITDQIGFMVLKGNYVGHKVFSAPQGSVVAKTTYQRTTHVGMEIELTEPGQYVVVPATFRPGATGTFALEMYAESPMHFNFLPDLLPWRMASIAGHWSQDTAGGAAIDRPRFRDNPRFQLHIPSGRRVVVLVYMEQPDGQGLPMGFFLFRQHVRMLDQLTTPLILDPATILFRSAFSSRDRVLTDVCILDPPMDVQDPFQYVITPTTTQEGAVGDFILHCLYLADTEISLEPSPDWHCVTQDGEWLEHRAGGPLTSATFENNPQFELTVPDTAVVYVFLTVTETEEAGRCHLMHEPSKDGLIETPALHNCGQSYTFHTLQGSPTPVLLVPCLDKANVLGRFRITVYASEPITVEPTHGMR